MSALSNNLLEFILGLLSNEQELRKFDSNKADYMRDAGYGGCEGEVDDYRKMVDDMRPVSHGHAHAKADTGHTDYQVVKHVTEHKHVDHKHDHHKHDDHHHHGAPVVNHHYGPTSHQQNNMYGDKYDVWAEDSTLAFGGGIAIGEDAEVKNSTLETHANRVQNSGDGSQVAGEDATATDDAFQNSGNTIGGSANLEAGDGDQEDNAAAAGHSNAATDGAVIDNSTSDDDTIVKIEDVDVNAVIGDNNDTQQQSDDAEMENEADLIVVDNPDLDLDLGFNGAG